MSNFSKIGRFLYGGGWQSALAIELGISFRSVTRWAAGSHPVPQGVISMLKSLVEEKQQRNKTEFQEIIKIITKGEI